MNIRGRVSMVLVSIPLLALLFRAYHMVTFVQITERMERRGIIYEHFVHEAGFAQVAIAAIGLLILFIPFRKRESWAWWALTLLLLIYFVPTLVLPHLRPFPGWDILWQGIFTPGLARSVFLSLLFPALMLVGLALSAPQFFRKASA